MITLQTQYPTNKEEWIADKVTAWTFREIVLPERYRIQFITPDVWSGVKGFHVHVWDNDARIQRSYFCTLLKTNDFML
jgi:hypothetical protein